MSADNGIYIAEFPDGFRVAERSAIENIDYYPEGSKESKEILKSYFGDSKLFKNEDDAWKEARRIYNEIMESDFPIVEYGISFVGKYESFD